MLKIIISIMLFYSAAYAKLEIVVLSKDIPRSALGSCLDLNGKIAEPKEPWNYSDARLSEVPASAPRTRLIKACKTKDQTWFVLCEKGGFTIRTILLKSTLREQGTWNPAEVQKSASDFEKNCEM